MTSSGPSRWRAKPTTCWPRMCASARTASPLLPRCRCRIRMRRPTSLRVASRNSDLSARWSMASRKPATPDNVLYYDAAAVPPVLARGRGARRAVLSASPQSAAKLDQNLRRPSLAARTQLGILGGDCGARAAADRLWPVRRMPAAENRARSSRRRHPGAAMAHRRPQWLDESEAHDTPRSKASATISASTSTSPRREIFIRLRSSMSSAEMGADRVMFSVDWPFERRRRRRGVVRPRRNRRRPAPENRPR